MPEEVNLVWWITGAIALLWLPFLVPWRKLGVVQSINEGNWGPCIGPMCRIMSWRCSAHYCGLCCRKMHDTWSGHTSAPLLSGEIKQAPDGPANTLIPIPNAALPARYGGTDRKESKFDEKKVEEPITPPQPGEMEELETDGVLVALSNTTWQPKVFD